MMSNVGKKVGALSLALACVIGLSSVSEVEASDKARGEKVYKEYCVTCHQANGQGTPKVFPPLAKSDYLKKNNKQTVIQSVIFGLNGKMTVNGVEYNGVMAPLPSKYTDADVAAVLTYVYSSWGNTPTTVTEAEVKKVRAAGKPGAAGSKKKK